MIFIASLLFAITFAASVGAIVLTLRNAMPRIIEIVEAEFAPAIQVERKIIFGEVKTRGPISAAVITFPAMPSIVREFKLAA